MEIAREIEYQRRSKLLRRICREYNLTEGRVSERLLESDILINHQLEVCILMTNQFLKTFYSPEIIYDIGIKN